MTDSLSIPDLKKKEPPAPGRLIDRARSRYWLAPMAGITDVCYRQLMDEMGAGLLISELVSTKGLRFNSKKTREMIRVHEQPGTPVGIQLFGEDAEDYITASPWIEKQGADFIDINLGCPVKKVVKKGCGAALMRNPAYLEQFLTMIRKNIGLPLTVKMRTGWSSAELTLLDCVKAAEQAGCEWVAVHGRTREQGYSGRADWDLIAEVKQKVSIPIIGNGDLRDADTARQYLLKYELDGVMIGRGALRNPWIFQECTQPGSKAQTHRIDLIRRYYELLNEYYDKRVVLLLIKKFAVWMAFGYPGASAFRGSMFQQHTRREALELAESFFKRIAHLPPPRFDSSEAFMMGGHG